MAVLKVGDTVMWRGGFGADAPKPAVVEGIQTVKSGEKYGDNVKKLDWKIARTDCCVVDLDNGCWAYGDQISPTTQPVKEVVHDGT